MTEEQNFKILACREKFYEFVQALVDCGVRAVSADFEERETDKVWLAISVHCEVANA